MTTREKLKEMLTSKGMFDTQADLVLEKAIPKIEKLTPGYNITWDRPAKEYPNSVYIALWITLSETALEWIDENLPRAYFRSMFV